MNYDMRGRNRCHALVSKKIQGISIPNYFKKAMISPQAKEWEEVVETEINQLVCNKSWE